MSNLGRLPCPDWEYADIADAQAVLQARALRLIRRLLLEDGFDALTTGRDTRPVHAEIFEGLTPPGFEWFAGNYRGARRPCLEQYEVKIDADPLVGTPSASVTAEMQRFGEALEGGLRALDAASSGATNQVDLLLRAVRLAALLFTNFLTIHPYANGNGHLARFLVWLILRRYGYAPELWTIHPRPSFALYSAAISAYRRGETSHLEKLILLSILPQTPP